MENYSIFPAKIGKAEPDTAFLLPDRIGHLPQRLHSQESGYSPALKPNSGYSHAPEGENDARDYEDWEKKERCDKIERAYNAVIEAYKENPHKLEEANEMIRDLNNEYVPHGCPALPEITPPPVDFALRKGEGLVKPKR